MTSITKLEQQLNEFQIQNNTGKKPAESVNNFTVGQEVPGYPGSLALTPFTFVTRQAGEGDIPDHLTFFTYDEDGNESQVWIADFEVPDLMKFLNTYY